MERGEPEGLRGRPPCASKVEEVWVTLCSWRAGVVGDWDVYSFSHGVSGIDGAGGMCVE